MFENSGSDVISPESDLSFLDVAILVSLRKRYILISTAIGTALVFTASFLLTDRFTASTVLIPPTDPLTMSLLLNRSSSSDPRSSLVGNIGTQKSGEADVALLHTRTIQDSLITRFDLAARYGTRDKEDTRERLRTRSKIVLGRKDGLIEISVEDSDPRLAADLANGYANEFQSLVSNLAFSEARQRRDLLEKQLVEAQKQLAISETELVSTQNATGIIEPKTQTASLIQAASSIRARIVSKEVEINAMRSSLTESNPELVRAKQELFALKALLQKATIPRDQSDSGLMSSTGQVPPANIRYARALRDLRDSEANFDLVAYMLEAARADERRHGAFVQIADPAKTPDTRTFPQRVVLTVCASLTVFFFILSTVFAREGIRRSQRISEACLALRANLFDLSTKNQTASLDGNRFDG